MEKIIKNKMFENRIKSNDYKLININKYLLKEKSSKLNLYNFKISIILLFILFFLSKSITKKIEIKDLIFNSEITLVINGSGEQQIISEETWIVPIEVYINNTLQNTNLKKYNFNNERNEVRIILNAGEISLYRLFSNCINIISIDLSNFDISSVISLQAMFFNCYKLESLNLSNFDTRSVSNMNYMFYECKSLTSLDISSFDTSLVDDMQHMFDGCNSLTSLDLSKFDTSSVTDMVGMFYQCFELQSLDLNNFKTQNVQNMVSMFYKCNSLKSLYLNNFDTSQVSLMNDMFND